MKISFYLIIIIIFTSCIFKRTVPFKESPKGMAVINGSYEYTDFPNEDTPDYGELSYIENFEEGGERYGKIIDGYKEGKWLSGDADFDTLGNVYAKGKIYKEEYFKHGLRDSIFRQFDNDGKVIYETTFKMGTGLWKEFYGNGKIHFEANTKDGYFTDTLYLHNEEDEIFEKRLYKKDLLVYYAGNDWCLKYRYKPNDSTYLEVDSYEVKNLKQGAFRNTFRYKTKEEFEDDNFAKNNLKR
ncbi:toxin-antitoxin system YwqK family antitoxin [Flavobacterium aquidurense]|uniref:toxin-antitoxin system YwqK family antitoxin n=1 Tax=Flavobacterium aquidurense TaxID=362413 RepID=UPI0037579A81